MRKKPLLIGISVFICLGFLVLFGIAMHRAFDSSKAHQKVVKDQQDGPDLFNEVSLRVPGNKDGYWELKVAKTENKTDLGLLHTIRGKYFRGSKEVCRISGETGRINWEKGILTLSGRVELISTDGRRLSADRMIWDPGPGTILAEQNVDFSAPNLSVNAVRLITDLDFTRAKCIGMTNTKVRTTEH